MTCLCLVLAVAVASTTGGMYFSTALVESKLEVDRNESEAPDGGFSSLEAMLQWALGEADPGKLRDAADDEDQLGNARANIREVLDNLQVTSDAQLMKVAIADLNNSSLARPDRVRALYELVELVEPIDNANNLHQLGGLVAVAAQLDDEETEVRTLAAWVLGKASQSNPVVQAQVVDAGLLPVLMRLVLAEDAGEAVKAMFAVAAVVRDFAPAQRVFWSEGGSQLLNNVLSNCAWNARLVKKSVQLVGDLADFRGVEHSEGLFLGRDVLKAVVGLTYAGTGDKDLETQEKALRALQSLGKLSDEVRVELLSFCQLEAALHRMKSQLEELMDQGGQAGDYARELELLMRSVLHTVASYSTTQL